MCKLWIEHSRLKADLELFPIARGDLSFGF